MTLDLRPGQHPPSGTTDARTCRAAGGMPGYPVDGIAGWDHADGCDRHP
jgi:hypothetical protein